LVNGKIIAAGVVGEPTPRQIRVAQVRARGRVFRGEEGVREFRRLFRGGRISGIVPTQSQVQRAERERRARVSELIRKSGGQLEQLSEAERVELARLQRRPPSPRVERRELVRRGEEPLSPQRRVLEERRQNLERQISAREREATRLEEKQTGLQQEQERLQRLANANLLQEGVAIRFQNEIKQFEQEVESFNRAQEQINVQVGEFEEQRQEFNQTVIRMRAAGEAVPGEVAPTRIEAVPTIQERGAFGLPSPEVTEGRAFPVLRETFAFGKSFAEGEKEGRELARFFGQRFGVETPEVLQQLSGGFFGALNVPVSFVFKPAGAVVQETIPKEFELFGKKIITEGQFPSVPIPRETGAIIRGLKDVPVLRGFIPFGVEQEIKERRTVLTLGRPEAAEALVVGGSLLIPSALKVSAKPVGKAVARRVVAKVDLTGRAITKGQIGDVVFETKTRIPELFGDIETRFGGERFRASLRQFGVEVQPEIAKPVPKPGVSILEPVTRAGEKGFVERFTFTEPFREPFEQRIFPRTRADVIIDTRLQRIFEQQVEPFTQLSLEEAPGIFSVPRRGTFLRRLQVSEKALKLAERQQELRIKRILGRGKIVTGEKGRGLVDPFGFGETVGLKITQATAFESLAEALTARAALERFPFRRRVKVSESLRGIPILGVERRGIVQFFREEAAVRRGLPLKETGKRVVTTGLGEFGQKFLLKIKRGKKGEIILKADVETTPELDLFRPDVGRVTVGGKVVDKFVGVIVDPTIEAVKGKGRFKPKVKRPTLTFTREGTTEASLIETGRAKSIAEIKQAVGVPERPVRSIKLSKKELNALKRALTESKGKTVTVQVTGRGAAGDFAQRVSRVFGDVTAQQLGGFAGVGFAAKQFVLPRVFAQKILGATRPLELFKPVSVTRQQEIFRDRQIDLAKERAALIPKELVKEFQKQFPRQVPKELERLIPKTIPIEIPKEIEKTIPRTIPKIVPRIVPKIVPRIVPKIVPRIVPGIIPKIVPGIIPVTLPVQRGPPPFLGLRLPPTEFFGRRISARTVPGYNAFVKERPFRKKKFKRVTRRPLPKELARERGLRVADITTAQSVKLKKTSKRVRAQPPPVFSRVFKFSFKPKKNVYVEKRIHAIDTPSEVSQLSVAKFLAQERRQAQGLGSTVVDESTARTFLLSRSRKRGRTVRDLEGAFKASKFRKPKGKTRLPRESFVELSKFAIDSPSEKKGISAAGRIKAERNRRIRKVLKLPTKKRKRRRK
jgi:hypothetical protein